MRTPPSREVAGEHARHPVLELHAVTGTHADHFEDLFGVEPGFLAEDQRLGYRNRRDLASSGPICASPGSLPACAQKRSSWMQCSAGIASSARRCENICAAGNSSRQHASSQVDPASYGCKPGRKLPPRLESTAGVRLKLN